MAAPRRSALSMTGIDGIALKPSEHSLSLATNLDADLVTIDFEGNDHVPDPSDLDRLATDRRVRVTVPVRAEGFDPLGDDQHLRALPDSVDHVFVAGHPAYLEPAEQARAIGPRLRAAASDAVDPWIGTEGVERLALAIGGTQFELLSGTTAADVEALRSAGVTSPVAIYAPTVLSSDPDTVLDGVGSYVARRGALDQPADGPTDASATGQRREQLLAAAERYALVGDPDSIADQVKRLREAGVNTIIAYPAAGFGD